MVKFRRLRKSPLERRNLLGKDSQRRLLNIARLAGNEPSISSIPKRAQQCLWDLAIAFIITGGEDTFMHDDETHRGVVASKSLPDGALKKLRVWPTPGGAIAVIVRERA